ncbi:hypothetical protein [Brucella pseudintermedia]|uniref:hypothetical protein n=1 Tax=Brucella pseudintermedia TaxID=370111 RepID=UPI00124F6D94|nr:hypothetical protein [Brucella pseudintermedia]KAB2680366.1 recombinase RecT [Brucella pseudintermedia]
MNDISTQQVAKRDRIDVLDAVPLLDTGRFEHMQRVATVMARSTLMPESLYMTGKKDEKEMLPYEQILSNCFLVVNQAVRWGLDPFAVAQCVSVVHGKLCYEGKLVSAVLQAKMGMSLHHHFDGEGDAMRIYLSDKPLTEKIIPELRPGYRRQDMRLLDGSVAEWKTTGTGTPWTAKNFNRMLVYRGTRDWCRIYEPALMLGVYTDDEMVDMTEASRFRRANDITPVQTVADPFGDEPQSAKIEEAEIVTEETEIPASEPDAGEQGVSEDDAGQPSAEVEKRELMRLVVQLVALTKECDPNDPETVKAGVMDWAKGFMTTAQIKSQEGIAKARKITSWFGGVAVGFNTQQSALEDACALIGADVAELDEVE